MNKHAVRLKITLWYTLIMMLLVSGCFFVFLRLQKQNIENVTKAKLSTTVGISAEKMKSRLENMLGKGYISSVIHKAPISFQYYNRGTHILLYDLNGNMLTEKLSFIEELPKVVEDNKYYVLTGDDVKYYVYDKKISLSNGSEYWIRGVLPSNNENIALTATEKYSIVLVVMLVIAAAVGGYALLSSFFAPIKEIADKAQAISEGPNLSGRICLKNSDNEFGELAEVFNGILDKIEESLEKEKQFISDASHELRTPVTVLLSECEYLKECDKDEEEYDQAINAIDRQTKKMAVLINELLLISRMDKGALKLQFEETDISELVNFTCEEQVLIHNSDISLIQEIEPEVVAVVDKMLILRLLSNLISNAYKFNKKDGQIRVRLKKEDKNIVLSVTDTGIGIPKEHLSHIWDRFYQIDSSRTKSHEEGAGLGLSMVKWIAEAHNGTIAVNSIQGKGSEFIVILPC